MVTAIVLINAARNRINEVADRLLEIDGVSEVYSVAGKVDLVAMIRVQNNEDLARVVTEQMLRVDGMTKTETLIAFRAYSQHDLAAMFSIGLR